MNDPLSRKAFTGLYRDGAMIQTSYSLVAPEIKLVIARDHDTPDEVFVMTRGQALELVYALTKALLQQGSEEDRVEDEA